MADVEERRRAVYEHGDVLVRGWSGADYARVFTPPVPGVTSGVGFGHVISQRAALDASDAGTVGASRPHARLIRSDDIANVDFRPGIMISRIRLHLKSGELITLLWMRRGPTRINPNSASIELSLRRAFSARFQIS
ncbi:MAG TPA: hypothetical protein VFI54_15680 [Solirubrobacteraceae bacterium]|nr:hypothetical protein [Solirubrobacteraceae bacterium]